LQIPLGVFVDIFRAGRRAIDGAAQVRTVQMLLDNTIGRIGGIRIGPSGPVKVISASGKM
jgi:hypothetical protein